MDIATVLREVETWSIEERLQLVETLWDRLVDTGQVPELTEVQRAELDHRIAALDSDPEDVVSWDAVQQFVRRRR